MADEKQPTYIFPDFLAKWMKKVDLRTQYEASMLSMSLLCIGLILSIIYSLIYTELALWFKIAIVINGLCGMVFMWSFVITTYQQYLAYMQSRQLDELITQPEERELTPEEEKEVQAYLNNDLKGGQNAKVPTKS